MKKIETCPCCNSTEQDIYPAFVAAFIIDYALQGEPSTTSLRVCRSCGFYFFDSRFTPEEANRLYRDYRSERYFSARHHFEFWYTERLNDNLGSDGNTITVRQTYLADFLGNHIDFSQIDGILDYGGDRGQFIPRQIGKRHYVHEVSGVTPISGVTSLQTENDLSACAPYSLVMVCHVLEHLSDPAELLARLHPLVARSGWLLIEVPAEQYRLDYSLPGVSQRLIPLLMRCRVLRTLNEIYTLFFRTRFNWLPPLGLSRLHEHINLFSPRALSALLERTGFQVIHCAIPQAHPGQTSGIILALAKIRQETAHEPHL